MTEKKGRRLTWARSESPAGSSASPSRTRWKSRKKKKEETPLSSPQLPFPLPSQPVPPSGYQHNFHNPATCVACAALGITAQGARRPGTAWSVTGSAAWRGAMTVTQPAALAPEALAALPPEEQQDELIRGVKAAVLVIEEDGSLSFNGIGGFDAPYGIEAYAVCARTRRGMPLSHPAPDLRCTCGFWLPETREDIPSDDGEFFILEVELAGKVIEHSSWRHEGEDRPPYGYRGEWQRVLSVAPPSRCWGCGAPGTALVAYDPPYQRRVVASCSACVQGQIRLRRVSWVPRPVTWLRERLGTEIRPGTLRDDLVLLMPQPGMYWA